MLGQYCVELAYHGVQALGATAPVCNQQAVADSMVNFTKSLPNQAQLLHLTRIYAQQPRSSPDGRAVLYCQQGPVNTELRGLYHCQSADYDLTRFTGGVPVGARGTIPFGFTSAVTPPGSCPDHSGPVPAGAYLQDPSSNKSKSSKAPTPVKASNLRDRKGKAHRHRWRRLAKRDEEDGDGEAPPLPEDQPPAEDAAATPSETPSAPPDAASPPQPTDTPPANNIASPEPEPALSTTEVTAFTSMDISVSQTSASVDPAQSMPSPTSCTGISEATPTPTPVSTETPSTRPCTTGTSAVPDPSQSQSLPPVTLSPGSPQAIAISQALVSMTNALGNASSALGSAATSIAEAARAIAKLSASLLPQQNNGTVAPPG